MTVLLFIAVILIVFYFTVKYFAMKSALSEVIHFSELNGDFANGNKDGVFDEGEVMAKKFFERYKSEFDLDDFSKGNKFR